MAITSYQDIKTMSADFKAMLNANKSTLPFDVDNSALVVLVNNGDLQTILSHNPDKLAVAIGLEHNRLTICLLGADANGHPLKSSSSNVSVGSSSLLGGSPDDEELPGEETWPDEEQITNSENAEYNDFFQ